MSKRQKLIDRLKQRPRNFTYSEAETLLLSLDFEMSNKGKTSGSRVVFTRDSAEIFMHKPHPQKELSPYVIKEILMVLEREELI